MEEEREKARRGATEAQLKEEIEGRIEEAIGITLTIPVDVLILKETYVPEYELGCVPAKILGIKSWKCRKCLGIIFY